MKKILLLLFIACKCAAQTYTISGLIGSGGNPNNTDFSSPRWQIYNAGTTNAYLDCFDPNLGLNQNGSLTHTNGGWWETILGNTYELDAIQYNTASNAWICYAGDATYEALSINGYIKWTAVPPYVGDMSATIISSPNFTATVVTTNFYRLPGDQVLLNASGRNLTVTGVNSNQLAVAIDTKTIYLPWSSGNGLPWSLHATFLWDGTNINSSAEFIDGDTNTAAFVQFTNYPVGTNAFSLTVAGDTNDFSFQTATVTASRGPTNGAAAFSLICLNNGTYYPSNTWSLFAITNSLASGDFWEGNSNGEAIVDVWLSNGVSFIKQIAP